MQATVFSLFFRTLGIPSVFFVFDRLLKWCTIHSLLPQKTACSLLPKWFSLAQYKNMGIAFSIPLPHPLTLFLSVVILFFLLFFVIQGYYKKQDTTQIFFTSLIFFGAFSNFIDRAQYSFVVDYIQLPLFWWIFNIADIMIVLGIIGLIWRMLRSSPKGSSS